jgi:hypothetical protein
LLDPVDQNDRSGNLFFDRQSIFLIGTGSIALTSTLCALIRLTDWSNALVNMLAMNPFIKLVQASALVALFQIQQYRDPTRSSKGCMRVRKEWPSDKSVTETKTITSRNDRWCLTKPAPVRFCPLLTRFNVASHSAKFSCSPTIG